jgi:Fur family iron response transcriptional regulator
MNQVQVDYSHHREDFAGMLRRHCINPTSQRVMIARIMFAQYQHLSADQVLKAINADRNFVSKATVYNTLNLFAEKQLIKEVIVDPNKIFYDSNTHPHYHIYNEDSGELSDLEPDKLELKGTLELPKNTVESGIDVIVRVRNRDKP